MKIGSSIMLELNNKQNTNENMYRCKVIDKDETYFYVDLPINMITGKVKLIPLTETISVSYVEKGVPFKFKTLIEKCVKLTVDALAIPLPDKDSIIKIQRREFVRIKTDVDVAMHFINRSIAPIISVTYDISAGGAAIILPPDVQVADNQLVTLYLVLTSSAANEYLKIDAKTIRSHIVNQVNILSLQFDLETEQEQQTIINYCFSVQREKRKQGLL